MDSDDFDELEFDDDLGACDNIMIFITLIVCIVISPIALTWFGCRKLYELIKNKLFN